MKKQIKQPQEHPLDGQGHDSDDSCDNVEIYDTNVNVELRMILYRKKNIYL